MSDVITRISSRGQFEFEILIPSDQPMSDKLILNGSTLSVLLSGFPLKLRTSNDL